MNDKSKVYVRFDNSGRVLLVDGGYSVSNISDVHEWTLIDAGYGDKYNLCQCNYFPKPIMDWRGIKRYRAYPFVDAPSGEIVARFFKDGEEYLIVERTAEEMDEDYASRPASPPTDKERIAALEAQLAAYEAAYAEGVNEA